MKKVNAITCQSLLDISIQMSGDLRSIFDLALQNNLSITDGLDHGSTIKLTETIFLDDDVSRAINNQIIATKTDQPKRLSLIETRIVDSTSKHLLNVIKSQNLLDISIQVFGDVRGVFDLAIKNNLSLTDDILRSKINVPASEYKDVDLLRNIENKIISSKTDQPKRISFIAQKQSNSISKGYTSVITKQSLFDVVIQTYGSINNIYEIANLNNLSLTQELIPGTKIKLPYLENDYDKTKELSKRISTRYKAEIAPALNYNWLLPQIFPVRL